ncbi:hypothetical protein [Flagellimonas pelagia]|uniref:hypothetical protein n=1 Tax=Flagellimonas pelagia TaxID=2306998 RepID=UPI00160507A9|nr:hypothetical protein [Allomuricauda maritima]
MGHRSIPRGCVSAHPSYVATLQVVGFYGSSINFNTKIRRNPTDLEDIFYAHIGRMDPFSSALLAANSILENSDYLSRRRDRYASFDAGTGKAFEEGKLILEDLYAHANLHQDIKKRSGQQELFENIINQFM